MTGNPQMAGELEEQGFEIVWNGKPEAGIARSVSLAAKALGGTPGAVCYLVCGPAPPAPGDGGGISHRLGGERPRDGGAWSLQGVPAARLCLTRDTGESWPS